jgi:hypothetical protein
MMQGGPAMYPTTYTSGQMIPGSIFNSAYVSERHADEAHSHWTREANRIDFEAVLRLLRSALSLPN